MRPTVLLPLLALAFVLDARPATACRSVYVDLFTRFDAATLVVVGRSGTTRAAMLPVTVESMVKGPATKTLHRDTRRQCGTILPRGRQIIAFANADGSIVDFTPWSAAAVDALARWATLTGATNRERLSFLSALRTSKTGALAKAARERHGIELRRLRKADHQAR